MGLYERRLGGMSSSQKKRILKARERGTKRSEREAVYEQLRLTAASASDLEVASRPETRFRKTLWTRDGRSVVCAR